MANTRTLMLNNVRASFPALFEKPKIGEDIAKKYSVTLMLDPKSNKEQLGKLQKYIEELISEEFDEPQGVVPCLRKGNAKGNRPEQDGYRVMTASNPNRPYVFAAGTKVPVTSQSESGIYPGCYVDAKIQLWAQNNKWGSRINAQLISIRFAADGESLSDSYVSEEFAAEGFEVEEDDFLAA